MPEDDEAREPLADAKAEVAAESTPTPVAEADEEKPPTLDDQRAYPNGAADVLLRVVDEDDEDDGEEPEEGEEEEDDEDDEDNPPVLIRVPRVQKWPDEAFDCLRDGRSTTRWAELVLSKTSLTKWRRFAPTRAEVNDFFGRWTDLTGQTEGKSRRYRRSLKAARAR